MIFIDVSYACFRFLKKSSQVVRFSCTGLVLSLVTLVWYLGIYNPLNNALLFYALRCEELKIRNADAQQQQETKKDEEPLTSPCCTLLAIGTIHGTQNRFALISLNGTCYQVKTGERIADHEVIALTEQKITIKDPSGTIQELTV